MKRVIYFTLLLGIVILLITIVISIKKPVRMIKYSDGQVEEVK